MAIITKNSWQRQTGERNFMAVHMQQYPFIFSDEKKYRIMRHIAFWGFWWLFQGFLYSFVALARGNGYGQQLAISMIESFFFMASHMFLGYTLMYFVVPQFLLKQRYWLTVMWTFTLFVVTGCISATTGLFVLPPLIKSLFHLHPLLYRNSSADFFLALLAGLRGGITIGGIAAAIKLMKYWYVKEQRNLQLQKENVESQLQLLKAQVHPHFLFNTLNNIYSYTQNTAPEAAKMVTGLSDLLRFILYECNQSLVPLSKELKMIRDYINLEKIRYGNKLELHMDLPDHTHDLHIAPLLLLPLVENSFKHGTSNMLEQPWVNLQVVLHDKQMHMKLMNGKTNNTRPQQGNAGIGILNVQKRLNLLYPGRHELTITNDEEVYIVSLKIELEQKKEITFKHINEPKLTNA
jgi:sensor histidine kinase YesM